jgi:hypothetical protein
VLALRTGWTPETIGGDSGGVTEAFRRAAHWALFAETLAGTEGLPPADLRVPPHATPDVRRGVMRLRASGDKARRILFPTDEAAS